MLATMRERGRSEGGFTLIELLVVMIIIAILMAVAIPTFLAQKNNAQKTKATANIKQLVNAVESCAATNTDGTYEGCTTGTQLANFEKGLESLGTIVTTAPSKAFEYQVVPLGAGGAHAATDAGAQGYMVQTRIKDGATDVYFAEIHREDGSLLKLCSAAPTGTATAITGATASGTAHADSKTCPAGGANAGKWG